MSRNVLISNLLLLLASVIWGFALVAQSVGAAYLGPCTFVFLRYALGAAVLAPISLLVGRHRTHALPPERRAQALRSSRRQSLRGGACIGLFLALASFAQQAGLRYTTTGKAGFITAFYVVLVPLLGLFFRRRPKLWIWPCAVLGLLGLYLISVNEGFTVGLGDALEMLCAVLFAAQILSVDHFSGRTDNPIQLAAFEFFFAAVVGLLAMLLFERPRFDQILAAWLPLVYAGVLSGALGYSLQILGQKHTDPAVATLLMSLEAVFSALAGWLLLHQALTSRELLGSGCVMAAVVLAQLPWDRIFQRRRAADGKTAQTGIRTK